MPPVHAEDITSIGVVGAGTIGRDVASSFAQKGFNVLMVDSSQSQLESAVQQIRSDLRVQSLFRASDEKADIGAVLGQINTGTTLKALAGADYVVENVTEDWSIKRAIYLELDSVCVPSCVFAVNTSAIPITRVGSVTGRAESIIGVHFMNPVPLIDTVEVIRGHYTSDDTLNLTLALLKRAGKTGIVVNDAPGFVTNRILMLTINEAIFCVQDRVATAESVDEIFKDCFGHKMGPLETGDLIGLDTILNSITVLYESFRDSKYRPAPLLQQMVDAGLLGRKSGKGFYEYGTADRPAGGSRI